MQGLGGHQAQAADGRDGDIDIVTRPYTAASLAHGGRMHVSVLENLARDPDVLLPTVLNKMEFIH